LSTIQEISGYSDLIANAPLVDFTISNQSQLFSNFMAANPQSASVVIKDYTSAQSSFLMRKFPLEDQGILLIYGPLPKGASAYPAEEIFSMSGFPALQTETGHGFGLLFLVEPGQVKVQYGNGVQTFCRSTLNMRYKFYSTGLPSLPVKEFAHHAVGE
jgi:hypothetical protein